MCKVKSLDLLSIEEAEKLPERVREYHDWWWLRSPGVYQDSVAHVNRRGKVNYNYDGIYVDDEECVRPALTLSNLDSSNLEYYGEYIIDDKKWIYIGKNKFLYNGWEIGCIFDTESNDYESSKIKRFLDNWLRKLQSKDLTIEEA